MQLYIVILKDFLILIFQPFKELLSLVWSPMDFILLGARYFVARKNSILQALVSKDMLVKRSEIISRHYALIVLLG
jgi:hypothetical protein